MRRFREPLIRAGKRRSCTVMELNHRFEPDELGVVDPVPGMLRNLVRSRQLVDQGWKCRPCAHLANLLAEVLEIEALAFGDLSAKCCALE